MRLLCVISSYIYYYYSLSRKFCQEIFRRKKFFSFMEEFAKKYGIIYENAKVWNKCGGGMYA